MLLFLRQAVAPLYETWSVLLRRRRPLHRHPEIKSNISLSLYKASASPWSFPLNLANLFEIFVVILYISGSMSPLFYQVHHNIINDNSSVRICVHSCDAGKTAGWSISSGQVGRCVLRSHAFGIQADRGSSQHWSFFWHIALWSCSLCISYTNFSTLLTRIVISGVGGNLPAHALVKFYLGKKLPWYKKFLLVHLLFNQILNIFPAFLLTVWKIPLLPVQGESNPF